MARKTFAIGNKETGKVSLWCSGNKNKFFVINGYWDGSIKDGIVHVKQTGKDFPGDILWEGWVTSSLNHDDDYNEAIKWIEERIKNPEQESFEADEAHQESEDEVVDDEIAF